MQHTTLSNTTPSEQNNAGSPKHCWGEENPNQINLHKRLETPPRVWGRPKNLQGEVTIGRNTPTCVGKTRQKIIRYNTLKKHPHVCGEDQIGAGKIRTFQETPPRVWGRLVIGPSGKGKSGNTPTCVGKTWPWITYRRPTRKHPHVCGEDCYYDR